MSFPGGPLFTLRENKGCDDAFSIKPKRLQYNCIFSGKNLKNSGCANRTVLYTGLRVISMIFDESDRARYAQIEVVFQ